METITIHPYNRISQPTHAHELAAATISPLCYRCLLPHRCCVQGNEYEDMLYAIPEIEEEDDEDYVVLNTEEDGLIEVLITIEAKVHFEIDSTLAEEEWSIIDEVSLAGEDDLVFVDAGHDDEGKSLNIHKDDALTSSTVEITAAPVSRLRLSGLRQMVKAVKR